MVGVLPDHWGHSLGVVLCRHVLKYFADRGVPLVRLDTDDWRHPAIGMYLDLGFEPLCRDPSHEPRWESVFAELEREPPESWLYEDTFDALAD
jgi:ribosomal protein S18 acetylase RimI-like enzyme